MEEFSYITDKWIYLGICINEYRNGRGNESEMKIKIIS
jgi:hypothetical protein